MTFLGHFLPDGIFAGNIPLREGCGGIRRNVPGTPCDEGDEGDSLCSLCTPSPEAGHRRARRPERNGLARGDVFGPPCSELEFSRAEYPLGRKHRASVRERATTSEYRSRPREAIRFALSPSRGEVPQPRTKVSLPRESPGRGTGSARPGLLRKDTVRERASRVLVPYPRARHRRFSPRPPPCTPSPEAGRRRARRPGEGKPRKR